METNAQSNAGSGGTNGGFVRCLGLFDSVMIVAGSMIGSGIFIVSADIVRDVGSAGWLLVVWAVTGVLTLAAALTYGELAGMMPRAGGQYVFLREAYSPFWGFLYGWTYFLVIQTGTIAAVAVAFARFLGVLAPSISPTEWVVAPVHLTDDYAISLSTQQLVAILTIFFLTAINTRGIHVGRWIQNLFTSVKVISLMALIAVCLTVGFNAEAARANFASPWSAQGAAALGPDVDALRSVVPAVSAQEGLIGLLVAICVAQVGSLFSADAWHSITITAGEARNPRRDIPLALILGSGGVILLYILANVAYLVTLPLPQIQNAADGRVGTAALQTVFHEWGAGLMAVAIMISTFGCNNGLVFTGARVYYAMALDGLFFRATGRLNARHVPAVGLVLQGLWASFLVLPRTRLGAAPTGVEAYGNLYGNLLDYVVFAVLIFYVLTVIGVFVLRRKQPLAERPYRALGYPFLPLLYVVGAAAILVVLALYRTRTTVPGLVIVLTGIPVYFLWRRPRLSSRNPAEAC